MALSCKHFGICGGCTLFGRPYADELAHKRAELSRVLGLDVPPLVPSPREDACRQKSSFVFGCKPGGRGLVMGHYALGSRTIVPIEECPVQSARANRIAFALRNRLRRANIGAADGRGGLVRHLVVRTTEDDAEAIATLVVTRNDKALRVPIRGLLASPEAPDGFFVNVNTRPGPFMFGDETLKVDGRSHVRETGIRGFDAGGTAAIDFLVSPDAFFQTNVGAAGELVRLVMAAVGPAARVLDLYCGSGLFALPLAQRGATVTAIEENRQAIADLASNVRLNRLDPSRITAIAARVEDAIGRAAREPWDAVVLDPPRDGCDHDVLSGVFETIRPARAVYVSCNAEALASDLPGILSCGYAIDALQPVDMFPHTGHIETVVTLRRTS